MTREEMVDALVEHYVDCVLEINAEEWISERMRYGMSFKPYDQRTDEEIKAEYDEMFEEDSQ